MPNAPHNVCAERSLPELLRLRVVNVTMPSGDLLRRVVCAPLLVPFKVSIRALRERNAGNRTVQTINRDGYPTMSQHSQEVVKQFEQQCIWAHQSWQTRKYLFDNKSSLSVFQQPHHEHFSRLSIILQEYWMQQVAKYTIRQAGRGSTTFRWIT